MGKPQYTESMILYSKEYITKLPLLNITILIGVYCQFYVFTVNLSLRHDVRVLLVEVRIYLNNFMTCGIKTMCIKDEN
jgi:hypothetical protein